MAEYDLIPAVEAAESLRRALPRQAIQLIPDDSLPFESPTASCLGRVQVALHGEMWPQGQFGPLLPICQINCLDLPYRPPALEDVALITVFVGSEILDDVAAEGKNGEGWLLRAYPLLDGLQPIRVPSFSEHSSHFLVTPAPLRPEPIVDYPSLHSVFDMRQMHPLYRAWSGRYFDEMLAGEYRPQTVMKVGGWPSATVQAVRWETPFSAEYVFQIAGIAAANLQWLDGGTAYFAKTKTSFGEEWHLAIQSS